MDLSTDEEIHKPIIARVHEALGSKLVKKIKSIQVVFNPNRYRLFLGQLEAVENRSQEAAFQRTLPLCVTANV